MERIIKEAARELRKELTPAEKILWKYLREKQLDGHKFRRQQTIGKFIADFICFEKRLIIELDGEVHLSQKERDSERDDYLKGSGFKVVRFLNGEIEKDIEGVLNKIQEKLDEPPLAELPRKWKRDG